MTNTQTDRFYILDQYATHVIVRDRYTDTTSVWSRDVSHGWVSVRCSTGALAPSTQQAILHMLSEEFGND
jgi:hypothetical protein